MEAKILDLTENKGQLSFTLKDVNFSIANGLRRTCISEIDTVVFRTTPYEKNDSTFEINNTRFNNEILKQRLSCVPIHIQDIQGFPHEQYIMECHVQNNTDAILYVTTKDFKIKNVLTNEYVSEEQRNKIFPKNEFTDEYIKFCRLRPKISDEVLGEELKMSCKFSIGNVSENSMFNVLSLCSYGNTLDMIKINETWDKLEEKYRNEGLTQQEIIFNKNNWIALDSKRIFEENSFDFKIKTIGVYSNKYIVTEACKVIIGHFEKLKILLKDNDIKIIPSDTTVVNTYDICLFNHGFTVGKIIEYILHSIYFEKEKKLTYVGFNKNHPHDDYSYVRVSLDTEYDMNTLNIILNNTFDLAINIYMEIKEQL